MFLSENALNPGAFPALRRFEFFQVEIYWIEWKTMANHIHEISEIFYSCGYDCWDFGRK
jgi:hypothetical protein